jgi:peptide/nickel transport system permease protein
MADTLIADVPEVEEERVAVASQAQLMWWRFRKHKLAVICGVVVVVSYLGAIGADFLAYSDPAAGDATRVLIPPQPIHVWDHGFHPYVYAVNSHTDPATFRVVYDVDYSKKISVCFFCHGFEYKFLGLIHTDIHLLGVSGAEAESSMFLLGTDASGQDMFSRLAYAARTSLFISLAAVFLIVILGIIIGAISGYYRGVTDTIIQRFIELIASLPKLPLWLGLAAAMPRDWNTTKIYLALLVIISLLGWVGIAREVRGRFVSLSNEDFITAAELSGTRSRRIMAAHMLPLMTSHLIATITLTIPSMIAAETSLSFLGLGLRPPAISWGVMLQQTQNLQSIAYAPWLMLPAIPVILIILAFNFLGDGLRDAADPYGV